ncbi:MAG: hypothetical protein M3P42_01730 [Actinomycetota bacterium]|nr:hypothetical protein [Actinomycetota bacterium]
MKDGGLLSSSTLNRALPWIAGAVLLLGVFAFWQTQTKTDGTPETFQAGAPVNPAADKTVPLPPQAREIAVQFLKTAVVRKNLDDAWMISGPDIRQNLSRKEWMTGNIPVVPYLDAALDKSPVKVDWSYANDVSLQVVMQPKDGSKEKPQVFYIGLKKFGSGPSAKWLVNYWAPYAPPPIPSAPQQG